jgi:hypothetical protein
VKYAQPGTQPVLLTDLPSQTVSSSFHPTLKSELGVFGATMMGLGVMIGTGVFVSIGIAAGVTGTHVPPLFDLRGNPNNDEQPDRGDDQGTGGGTMQPDGKMFTEEDRASKPLVGWVYPHMPG